MEEEKSKDIQKIEAIFGLLKIWRDNGGEESAYYPFTSLSAFSSLLKDQMNVERILSIIQEKTERSVSFRVETGRLQMSDRAGQSGVYPDFSDPCPVGVRIHISDLALLEKYFKQSVASPKIGEKKNEGGKIESIEIVKRDEDTKVTVVINEEILDKPIVVDAKGKYWGKLIEVVENGTAQSDDTKGILNYFNTNKKCPIYSRTGFELREIVTSDKNNYLSLVSSVSIKIKTAKILSQRRNKNT